MLVIFPKAHGDRSPRFTDHLSRVEGTTVRKLVLLTPVTCFKHPPLLPGILVLPSEPCLSIPPEKEKASGKKTPQEDRLWPKRELGMWRRHPQGRSEGLWSGDGELLFLEEPPPFLDRS